MILRASLSSFDSNVTFVQGLEKERQTFQAVINHPQCRATQYHYFASQRIEKYSIESINDAKYSIQKMQKVLEQQTLKLYEMGISHEKV